MQTRLAVSFAYLHTVDVSFWMTTDCYLAMSIKMSAIFDKRENTTYSRLEIVSCWPADTEMLQMVISIFAYRQENKSWERKTHASNSFLGWWLSRLMLVSILLNHLLCWTYLSFEVTHTYLRSAEKNSTASKEIVRHVEENTRLQSKRLLNVCQASRMRRRNASFLSCSLSFDGKQRLLLKLSCWHIDDRCIKTSSVHRRSKSSR